MKRISFLIAFASLMLLASGLAQGASEIKLDNGVPVTGYLGGDTVYADSAVRWNFRLIYTPGNDTAMAGLSNGFRVWTHSGGSYTDSFSAITYDSFPWAWSDIFPATAGLVLYPFSIDGIGADTVGFGGTKMLAGSGIVDGTDSLCWWIETTPTTDGDTLCIDSAFYPPAGHWVWARSMGPEFTPDWSGPHCFHVYSLADNLLIDSSSLTFEVVEGEGADTSTIQITSSGAKAELDFQIFADVNWLEFDTVGEIHGPSDTLDGTTPMDVRVIADFTGMDTGTYSATVTVTSEDAGNSPFDIPTDLSVGTDVAVDGTDLPTSYALSQNYPNPFNPNTEIKFDIPVRSHVTLTVYNVLGQRITTLVDKEMPPGSYVADWNSTSDNGTEVTSGIYFYKLETDDFIQTKKMLLLK